MTVTYGSDSPGSKVVVVATGVPFDTCRALLVGTAGTATVIDADGNTATDLPLQQGYNPIRVTKVTFGTASDIWAIY